MLRGTARADAATRLDRLPRQMVPECARGPTLGPASPRVRVAPGGGRSRRASSRAGWSISTEQAGKPQASATSGGKTRFQWVPRKRAARRQAGSSGQPGVAVFATRLTRPGRMAVDPPTFPNVCSLDTNPWLRPPPPAQGSSVNESPGRGLTEAHCAPGSGDAFFVRRLGRRFLKWRPHAWQRFALKPTRASSLPPAFVLRS